MTPFRPAPSAIIVKSRCEGTEFLIPYIDYSLCVGCGACAELFPVFFEMRDGRPWVINHEIFVAEEHGKVIYCCPFRAISIE